jgi:hypothetical protein
MEVDELKFNDPHLIENWAEIYPPTPPPSEGAKTAASPRESDEKDGSYAVESLEAPGAVHVGGNVEATDNLAPTAGEPIVEAEIAADPEEAIVAAYQNRQEALDEAQGLRQRVHLMERERIDVFAIAVASNKKEERRRCILTYCSYILIAAVIAGGVSAGVLLSGRSDSKSFST